MPTFDPVTIDEKPLIFYHTLRDQPIRYDPCAGPPGHEQEEEYKRWDARLCEDDPQVPLREKPLVPLVWEPATALDATGVETPFFPVPIDRSEIEELALPEQGEGYTVVDDHLEFRDIRLISTVTDLS